MSSSTVSVVLVPWHLARLYHRPSARPLWKYRPAWFVVAEQDRMIVQGNQRFMAVRMRARMRAHPVDHTPIVPAPAVVVDVLREAIAAVRTESAA
jgi:hypothetical protein